MKIVPTASSDIFTADSQEDLARKIEAVKIALADYLEKDEDDHLKSLEIMSINPRTFSTIIHLKAATSRTDRRLVMKTINHHPFNKAITDRENQAVVEYNILKNLYPKFEKVEKCSIPKPVLVCREIETLLTEFVDGDLLLDQLEYARYFSSRKGFQRLKENYYHCGRWLRYLKEFTGIRKSGWEALSGVMERIENRLTFIEDLRDPRCPRDFKTKIATLLEDQASRLSGEELLVSGRHSDFGPWNIMVGPHGVTVFDFLGYQEDLFPVDIIKMLMNFEDEGIYLAFSRNRIESLRHSFLEGLGALPYIQKPVLIICETLYRVSSIFACLTSKGERFHRRIERNLCLKNNLRWLMNHPQKELLWPFASN